MYIVMLLGGRDALCLLMVAVLQDLGPGDVLITVPLACTVNYINKQQQQQHDPGAVETNSSNSNSQSSDSSSSSSSRLAALRRLQSSVPAASDSGRGAWQFKVALEVRLAAAAGSSSSSRQQQAAAGSSRQQQAAGAGLATAEGHEPVVELLSSHARGCTVGYRDTA
jgi:cytoskeletal protein RodZ